MSTSNEDGPPAARVSTGYVPPFRGVPKPEEFHNVPAKLIRCLLKISPRIWESGAWWSLGGDLSQNLSDVRVRPTKVEILTDEDGVEKVCRALSQFGPASPAVTEQKLEREAEIGGKKYPVFVKSNQSRTRVNGMDVIVHGDYQIRVGEWEWGDPLFFRPNIRYLAGVRIPLMPLRLANEIYQTLGWNDRVQLIAHALGRPLRSAA